MDFAIILATCALLCAILASLWALCQRLLLERAVGELSDTQDKLTAERQDAAFHRITAEQAETGLVVQTLDGWVVWANPAYLRIQNRTAEEVIGNHPFIFAMSPDQRPSDEDIAQFRFDPDNYAHETDVIRENVRGDGSRLSVHISLSFHETADGEMLAVLACRDVTEEIERKEELEAVAEELAFTAAHDVLTGTANRAELGRFVEAALAEAKEDQSRIGLMHIDLDKFKDVNDTHGHSAGDALLVTVADRIRNHVRKKDLVARIGGDEFVVVCPALHSLSELKDIANALITAVALPVPWQNTNLSCNVSIGAALSDEAVKTADDMLVQSDFALYDVKRSGRGRVATYNHELHQRHMYEMELAGDLQIAVKNGSLCFHYQPIVCAETGCIRAVETLVRWDHPKHGILSPATFLPIAQATGLMAAIDYLAIDAALDMKKRMNAAHHEKAKVSINASPELLSDPEFLTRICFAIDCRGLDRDSLIVEVLETVVFQNNDGDTLYVPLLKDIADAGLLTVLDDFGSGNAGLAHLSRLTIAGIKVDISLIENLLTDTRVEKIFTALVNLCHALDLRVTTEGIETAEEAVKVTTIGSHTMQGYWIARPMPANDLLDWLDAHKPSAIAQQDAPRYLKAK